MFIHTQIHFQVLINVSTDVGVTVYGCHDSAINSVYFFMNYLQSEVVMDNSRIRNRKLRFFPRIEKNRNLDYNKLVHRFLLTWNTFIFDRDYVATFW